MVMRNVVYMESPLSMQCSYLFLNKFTFQVFKIVYFVVSVLVDQWRPTLSASREVEAYTKCEPRGGGLHQVRAERWRPIPCAS